jgi:hypothetical protein
MPSASRTQAEPMRPRTDRYSASKRSRPFTKCGSTRTVAKPGASSAGRRPANAFQNQAPTSPNMMWFIEMSDLASIGQFSKSVVAPLRIHQPQDGKLSCRATS